MSSSGRSCREGGGRGMDAPQIRASREDRPLSGGRVLPAAPWVTSSDLAAHTARRCCQGGVSPPYQPHTPSPSRRQRGACCRDAQSRQRSACFLPAEQQAPQQRAQKLSCVPPPRSPYGCTSTPETPARALLLALEPRRAARWPPHRPCETRSWSRTTNSRPSERRRRPSPTSGL